MKRETGISGSKTGISESGGIAVTGACWRDAWQNWQMRRQYHQTEGSRSEYLEKCCKILVSTVAAWATNYREHPPAIMTALKHLS
jgi:hypothetical protein